MKYLCIDIGNTRVKYLVYIDDIPREYHTSKNIDKQLIGQLVEQYKVSKIGVSSVRKKDKLTNFDWPKGIKILILDHRTEVPIKNIYESPETLGVDRLAAVIGAHFLYPDKNLVVIDLGTCITLDFIDKTGTYHGGNIAPGAMMRIKAMNSYTKNLPLVEIKYHEDLLGKNTTMALQNGVVRGTIFEIESFINSIKDTFGDTQVIFTGGDAKYFASYINYKIFVHQNLVLRGLRKIVAYNEH